MRSSMTRRRGIRTLGGGDITPQSFSGLVSWHKAETIGQGDGTDISFWADSSGNGRNAGQGTGSLRPLYKTAGLNGHPSVRFDGVDDLMAVGSYPSITTITAFVVGFVNNVVEDTETFFEISNGSNFNTGFALNQEDTTGIYFRACGSGGTLYNAQNAADDASDGVARIWSGRMDGSVVQGWKNGAAFSTTDVAFTGPNPNTTSRLDIGALFNGTLTAYCLGGDISELIIYNRALSTSERQAIEHYLGAKYGITLS